MGGRHLDGSIHVVAGLIPASINGAANVDSAAVSLENWDCATFILLTDATGTAGEDPTFRVRQATTQAANTSRNVAGLQWYSTDDDAVADLTDVLAEAGASGVLTIPGENASLSRIDVAAEDLADGYSWVYLRTSRGGSTTAKNAAVVVVLSRGRFMTRIPDQKTATAA